MNDLTKIAAVMAVVVAVFGCMVIASDDSDAASTIYVGGTGADDTTGTGTSAAPYATLAKAVEVAASGDTILLQDDISVPATLAIKKDITLNLGGHTLTIEKKSDFTWTGESLSPGIAFDSCNATITNGNVVDARPKGNTEYNYLAMYVPNNAVLNMDATIQCYVPDNTGGYNYAIRVDSGSTVNFTGEIKELTQTLTAEKTYGVVGIGVYGPGNTDGKPATTLNVNGGKIETTGFAVAGNGSVNEDDFSNTVINVTGGTIISHGSTGIYHPQSGVLSISGGSITGLTGVEMRAGTVNVTGGTIAGTGDTFESQPNDSGSTTTGAGIAVVQHTTKLNVKVNVTGGDVEGFLPLYQEDLQNNGSAGGYDKVSIEIDGGNFKSTGTGTVTVTDKDGTTTRTYAASAIYSENKTGFVSGGTFDGGMDEDLLAEGVEMDDSGKVVGQEGVTFDVTAAEFLATGSYSDDGKTVTFFLDRDYRITDNTVNFANLADQGYESISIAGNGHTIYGEFTFDSDLDDGESASYSVTISDLNLDGRNISDWGYGIVIQNQSPVSNPARTVDFTMTGGSVKNFDSKGIYLINVQSVYIQGVEIENCAYNTHYHDEANGVFKYYVRGDYAVDIDVTGITDAEIRIDDVAFSGKTGAVAALKVAQRGGAGDDPDTWGDASIYGVILNGLDFSASEAPRDIMLGSEPNITGDDEEELRDYNSAFTVLLSASGETVLSVWGDDRNGDRNLDVTLSDGSMLGTSCETSGGEHGKIGLELLSGTAKVSGVLGPNMSLRADEDAVTFVDFADESEGGLEIVEPEPELPPFIPFPPEQGGDPVEVYPSGDSGSSGSGDDSMKVVAVAAAAVTAAILAIVLASTYRKD